MGPRENTSVIKEELQQLQRFAADDVPTAEDERMKDERMNSLAFRALVWVVGATFVLTLVLLRRHLWQ